MYREPPPPPQVNCHDVVSSGFRLAFQLVNSISFIRPLAFINKPQFSELSIILPTQNRYDFSYFSRTVLKRSETDYLVIVDTTSLDFTSASSEATLLINFIIVKYELSE